MRGRQMAWTSLFRNVPTRPNEQTRLLLCVSVTALALHPVLHAQTHATQSIALQSGWNAVHVRVDPEPAFADDVFANLPVDSGAALPPSAKGAQFVENPEASLLSAYGWSVWYAPHRSDAFLSSLRLIHVNKAQGSG